MGFSSVKKNVDSNGIHKYRWLVFWDDQASENRRISNKHTRFALHNQNPCFSHGELCILFINYNNDGTTINSTYILLHQIQKNHPKQYRNFMSYDTNGIN